jgi:ferrous iron transport protein B
LLILRLPKEALKKKVTIALVGNPNSGKTSLFNAMTGLNQKVGNFPGVTVEMKTGTCQISESLDSTLIDLPGTYSLYPKRSDEWVSYRVLLGQEDIKPDMVVLVADASNLKRNLLFCSQIIDLKIPVVVALTMMDIARKKGTRIDLPGLERELGVPVVAINPRKSKGMGELKKAIALTAETGFVNPRGFVSIDEKNAEAARQVSDLIPGLTIYSAIHYLINHKQLKLTGVQDSAIEKIKTDNSFNSTRTQADEIMQRYNRIRHIMNLSVVEADPLQRSLVSERLDNILLHRRWGYLIMLAVLFLLFQSVFWIATYPMDFIEGLFAKISSGLSGILPNGWFSDLFINGIIAGMSGIFVFVPQIMILFGLITILEDSGYMARISFLTDKLMRKAGLNGKSVMPMISGYACAVPAIMSARSIENSKERLLTIMVTPLMSCSARLPVYTILISLIIPSKLYFGFLSLQGLLMMLLYVFGTVIALTVSWVMKWFIHSKEKSFFILELPVYRSPRWNTIMLTMVSKARVFVFEAGKVIMIISILLWALSNYGPPSRMDAVKEKYANEHRLDPEGAPGREKEMKSELLQNSFAGILGKAIEPAISPLGFDWKIGIALITSFAAREVFVGTMATLYSVGEEDDEQSTTLRNKMAAAVRTDGTPVYTLPTGLSLLVFYVLAMQCMSTLAIVKRETGKWKWAVIQLVYMTALAYLFSFLVYRIFS